MLYYWQFCKSLATESCLLQKPYEKPLACLDKDGKMSDNPFVPKPQDVIKMGPWVGVVLDIFASETSDKHILMVQFAKNVFKQQPFELHILEDMDAMLSPATLEELHDELARYEQQAQAEAGRLLTKGKKKKTREAQPAKL